jgi:hypothetical protein
MNLGDERGFIFTLSRGLAFPLSDKLIEVNDRRIRRSSSCFCTANHRGLFIASSLDH